MVASSLPQGRDGNPPARAGRASLHVRDGL